MSISTPKSMKAFVLGTAVASLGVAAAFNAFAGGYGGPYGFGTAATSADIASVDIDAMPDGRGLPAGKGTPAQGKTVYMSKCVACHGQ